MLAAVVHLRQMIRTLTATLCLITALFLARPSDSFHALGSASAGRALQSDSVSTAVARLPLSVDLNHDSRLDTVKVVTGGERGQAIQVTLDGIGTRELVSGSRFNSSGFLYTADVNHDDNVDLIQESEDRAQLPDVWLGDGKGNFVLAQASSPFSSDSPALPAQPFRPFSSGGQGPTVLAGSAADKCGRSTFRKLRPQRGKTFAARTPVFRWHTDPRALQPAFRLWIARRINAPPVSLFC